MLIMHVNNIRSIGQSDFSPERHFEMRTNSDTKMSIQDYSQQFLNNFSSHSEIHFQEQIEHELTNNNSKQWTQNDRHKAK